MGLRRRTVSVARIFRMARSWLVKSEPDCYPFEQLEREGRTMWDGVRNYQARNFMRDEMSVGDLVLYYHSSTAVPGVIGVARVASAAYPDPTQFDEDSEYYDPKATKEEPRWYLVDLEPVERLPRLVSLEEMKSDQALEGMTLLRRGNRLSVMPVEPDQLQRVRELAAT